MKQDWCYIRVEVAWKGTRQFRELQTWLDENVDYGNYDWGANTKNPDNRVYYFAHRQDATMFALRWS